MPLKTTPTFYTKVQLFWLMVLALTAGIVLSIRPLAAASGSISGTVTDGSDPLPNILVELFVHDQSGPTNSFVIIDSTYTNSSGAYEFTALADNYYVVQFTDEAGDYVSEYYDDIRSEIYSAQNLQIAGGNAFSNIDAILAISSHITGRVTDAANGNPIAGTSVMINDFNINESANTLTDSDGYYTISDILPGSYTVYFGIGYGPRFYTPQYYDTADYDNATPVVVGAGETATDIDAALTEGGYITGRVTAEDGTTPLANITVRISDNFGNGWLPGYTVTTDTNGDYHFDGLLALNYRLTFFDEAGLYIQEHYDNVTDFNNAADIPVTLGQTTANINASLAEAQLPPIAVQDVVTTTLNAPITIDALANDSDPNGDPLTIDGVDDPNYGSSYIWGNHIIYAPEANYVGTDSFSYSISDGQGGSASAQVTINIIDNEQEVDVDPTQAQTAVINTADYDLTIDIPSNALPPQANKLVYRGLDAPTSQLPGASANIHFTLTLLDAIDQEIPNPTFATPLSVTIQYNPALLPAGMDEADIQVYFFSTSTGAWESIPVISRNPAANRLVIELTHFTEFALADAVRVYLPMIIR